MDANLAIAAAAFGAVGSIATSEPDAQKDGSVKVIFESSVADYKLNPDGSPTGNLGQDGKGTETLVRQ